MDVIVPVVMLMIRFVPFSCAAVSMRVLVGVRWTILRVHMLVLVGVSMAVAVIVIVVMAAVGVAVLCCGLVHVRVAFVDTKLHAFHVLALLPGRSACENRQWPASKAPTREWKV